MNEDQRNAIATSFETWQRTCPLSCWVILKDGQHVATIQRKGMATLRVTVIMTTLDPVTKRRSWHKGVASGGGYDRDTAALDGLKIGDFQFQDQGKSWQGQLMAAGFEVISAVW